MIGFSACMTKKKLARLQAEYQILRTRMDSLGAVQTWEERKFRPGDRVLITIKTQSLNEQQLAFFENGKEMDYTISDDSTITLPLIGEVFACKYSRPQLASYIKERVSQFIKDPFVQIKPVQIQVKVLGQVEKQGIFTVPEADANLISVLAQVGGVSQFAKRDSVMVIRESGGMRKTYYVDTRDGQTFFNSPVYRLEQNDIIVVKPSDYFFKSYRNQEVGINIARIAPLTTILGLLLVAYPLISLFNR